MVKHIQTIRRQIADELLGCVWPFCEIGVKDLETDLTKKVVSHWIYNLC